MLIAGERLRYWRSLNKECIQTPDPQLNFHWHATLQFDAKMVKNGYENTYYHSSADIP